MKQETVFSGMRPSGRLHLGNYLGALQNWVALQDQYECIYAAVDIHALTDMEDTDTRQIGTNIHEMVLDWLAAGVDPNKSIIFVQSHVPEVMTLHTLLSMLTPMGWLLRVPTFKDKVRQLKETEDTVSYGLVGYPVLMTSDILLYKANAIPVGEDQLPHIELAREIVRRFNYKYGSIFPEPKAKLTEVPLIIGLDGQQKMSKSLNNQIELAASPEETRSRVLTGFTDPQRLRRTDPGRPWICNMYNMHKLFNSGNLNNIYKSCTSAEIGCVDCKGLVADGANRFLEPLRERRRELAAKEGYVWEILADGARRARAIAKETISEVKDSMGLPKADI